MTASVSPPASVPGGDEREFDLVESSAGWRLTITLTDRLREALSGSASDIDALANFTVRVAPNLVPGDAFDVELCIREPESARTPAG